MFTQDNFIFAQPGIQTKVKALKDLISRIDGVWLIQQHISNCPLTPWSSRMNKSLTLLQHPWPHTFRSTILSISSSGCDGWTAYSCASCRCPASLDWFVECVVCYQCAMLASTLTCVDCIKFLHIRKCLFSLIQKLTSIRSVGHVPCGGGWIRSVSPICLRCVSGDLFQVHPRLPRIPSMDHYQIDVIHWKIFHFVQRFALSLVQTYAFFSPRRSRSWCLCKSCRPTTGPTGTLILWWLRLSGSSSCSTTHRATYQHQRRGCAHDLTCVNWLTGK